MFLKSKKDNKFEAVLEADFYHDCRGPELQNVVWGLKGSSLLGFEYFNPDDEYTKINLKHLSLTGVEAYSMSSDELHGDIKAISGSKAAIFEVKNSSWVASLNQAHVSGCKHFQIMFYDEIFDVICTEIKFGAGELENALNNAVSSLDKKEMLSGHFKPIDKLIDKPTWTDLGDNSNKGKNVMFKYSLTERSKQIVLGISMISMVAGVVVMMLALNDNANEFMGAVGAGLLLPTVMGFFIILFSDDTDDEFKN
jgi:hypothetical protein